LEKNKINVKVPPREKQHARSFTKRKSAGNKFQKQKPALKIFHGSREKTSMYKFYEE
jgi:hypothetical protein